MNLPSSSVELVQLLVCDRFCVCVCAFLSGRGPSMMSITVQVCRCCLSNDPGQHVSRCSPLLPASLLMFISAFHSLTPVSCCRAGFCILLRVWLTAFLYALPHLIFYADVCCVVMACEPLFICHYELYWCWFETGYLCVRACVCVCVCSWLKYMLIAVPCYLHLNFMVAFVCKPQLDVHTVQYNLIPRMPCVVCKPRFEEGIKGHFRSEIGVVTRNTQYSKRRGSW